MNILALPIDWIVIVLNAITNFFNGIGQAFENIGSATSKAIVDFLNLVGTNIETQGQALANYFTNLGKSFENAWKWVKNISAKSLSYAAELLMYNPTIWLIRFGTALIMLSVEIVVDIGVTLFDYVTNRVPAVLIDAIFGIPGLNLIPGVGALKNALKSVISNLFTMSPKIVSPDIAGDINGALNAMANAIEDEVSSWFS